MGMIDTIKRASIRALNASNPVNIVFGEVLDTDNFKIKIDQKLILDRNFFIIPESLTRHEIDLTHEHTYTGGTTETSLSKLVIREGLKQGDKVLLLRVQGGQQYIVLDKVV